MDGSLLVTRRLITVVVVVKGVGGLERVQKGGINANLRARIGMDRGVSSMAAERGYSKVKKLDVEINSKGTGAGCRCASQQETGLGIYRRRKR